MLGQVCDSLLKVLSDSTKLEDASHVRSRVKPALLTAPGRRCRRSSQNVLHCESYREPDCAGSSGNFKIFLGISHRPAIAESQSVLQTPALSTLTPMYVEEVELTTDDLREQIDGENASTLRFLTTMLQPNGQTCLNEQIYVCHTKTTKRSWMNSQGDARRTRKRQRMSQFLRQFRVGRQTDAQTPHAR